MRSTYAAVDLGNSSGRISLAEISDTGIDLREICRIPNAPVRRETGWHWDVLRLRDEVLAGLHAGAADRPLAGIGVDTWGVDYALLDANGQLIDDPFSYRDDRTLPMVAVAEQRMPARQHYALTGCQAGAINTLYQLLVEQQAGRLEAAERFLMMPDLFAYWLTGIAGADESIGSTTQLFDPVKRDWSWPAISAMQLPRSLFAPVRKTGTVIGPTRNDHGDLAGIPVIAAAGHDTAAAFVAATGGPDQLVISIGTWSLLGVELEQPLISEAGRAANFTNEIGVLGTIRFLRNAAGLWLIQECLREWEDLTINDVVAAAGIARPFASLFDPDDRRFMEPGAMVERVSAAGDGLMSRAPGSITRSILESLSLNHRWLLESVERVLGRSLNRARIVGGGSQSDLLCQMTADATGLPVVAGPAEASTIGNAAMQAIATGQIADLDAARVLIDRSFPPRYYEPAGDRGGWEAAYARWRDIANR
jgi:rhamnulokinase